MGGNRFLCFCLLLLAWGCAPPFLIAPDPGPSPRKATELAAAPQPVPRGAPVRKAATPGEIQVSVVVAEGGPGVKPAEGRTYRGRMQTITHQGRTLLVNHVSLEDYVMGVLPAEVPAVWPLEALKAMAVAARTYAWHKWQRRAGEAYHLLADTRDQQYCGRGCEHVRTNRATKTTSGFVVSYRGKVVPAFSHACCAGGTEDVREVWGGGPVRSLRGVKCRWCRGSKHYGPWTLVLDRVVLAERLAPVLGGSNNIRWIKTDGETRSGRVWFVKLNASGKIRRFTGAKFRALIGYNELRSARFTIKERGPQVEFKGTGWGHGVGLCQEGAGALAKKGWNFKEILRHYFPGASIRRLKR